MLLQPLRKCLISVLPSMGLLATSLSFSPLAEAALPCKTDTVSVYQNGSIASCTISSNVDVSRSGFSFTCKQGYSITFDADAAFTSCVIATPVEIQIGSVFKTCPKESRVHVSTIDKIYQPATVSC